MIEINVECPDVSRSSSEITIAIKTQCFVIFSYVFIVSVPILWRVAAEMDVG